MSFKILKAKGLVSRALIIAPRNACYEVWDATNPETDFQKYEDFKDLTTAIAHDRNMEKALASDADFTVMTPEGLSRFVDEVLDNKGHVRRYLKKEFRGDWPWDVLVIDESTRFKHSSTVRSKRLSILLRLFSRRYILTGGINPNGYMDLFGQIYIIDEGRTLGKYVTHYRNRFFTPSGYGGFDWKLQPGAEKKIQKAIAPVAFYVDDEKELGLPPLIEVNRTVSLPGKARLVYEKVENEFFALIDKGSVTAVNAGAKSSKLRQLATGCVYLDGDEDPRRSIEERKWAVVHDEKFSALGDLVEEYGGRPLLVGYEFSHERIAAQKFLKKEFKLDAPHVGGDVPPKRAREIFAAFNDGKLPVLFGQYQTVSLSLNLQRGGRGVVMLTVPWDYELYDQFIRRVRRQGQAHSITVHRIVARETTDFAVLDAIEKKGQTQRSFMDALRRYGERVRGRGRITPLKPGPRGV